jgi:hypothetical protein
MPNPNDVAVGIWKGEQRRFRDGVLLVGVFMPTDDPVPQSTFDALAIELGGTIESAHHITGWMVVSGHWDAADLEMVAKNFKQNHPNDVTFVQPDFLVETAQAPSTEPYGEQWGLRVIDMLEAWGLEEGSSDVLIAVVDTGMPMEDLGSGLEVVHEDLDAKRFIPGIDMFGAFADAKAENPHGVEVTGIMVANVTVRPLVVPGEGIKGINLISPVFPCRAVEDSKTYVSYVRGGIEEVLKVPDRIASGDLSVLAEYRGISKIVVNLSLYVSDTELPDDALDDLMDRIDDMPWVLLCCSTGIVDHNDAGDIVTEVERYPAAFSLTHPTSVVAVGGTQLSGTKEIMYTDSATGDHVTLVAPAKDVLTTYPMVKLKYGSTLTKYATSDGTSMAAPFATAIASMVWSKCPAIEAEDVIACLTGGCEDVPAKSGETMDPKEWGHGRINAYNAIPDVKVITTGLAFVDVATGDWLALPIQLQVKSPIPLTLHSEDITVDGGSSPGTQFRGTTVTVAASASPDTYDTVTDLTVEYHGTGHGSFGSALVRIRCDEFGEGWVREIKVTGNTHDGESFFVLCADKSGSMTEASGVGTKTRKTVLEESAGILIDAVPDGQALEVISFDGDAHAGLGAMVIDDSSTTVDVRQILKNFIVDLAAEGSTSIGDAVEMAQSKLDAATAYDNLAMIVLTDGKQTAHKYVSEVSVSNDVYAIGMGMPGPVDAVTLTALVSGSPNGYLLMTGPNELDDEFKIAKYLQQILCDIKNVDIASDPTGRIRADVPVRIPFLLTDADTRAEVVVMMPKGGAIKVTLETPDHRTVDPLAAHISRSGDNLLVCTLDFTDEDRDVFASYAGLWNVVLKIDERTLNDYRDTLTNAAENRRVKNHGMLYTVAVNVESTVRMKVGLVQDGFTTDSNVTLSALVRESGIPITGRVQVDAHMLHPNGTTSVVPLRPSSPGVFEVTKRLTAAGVYQCRFVATGLTRTAQPFTREHTRTAVINTGTTTVIPSIIAPPPSP